MYLGIDLGTSNSAVVGNHGGNLRLFKTVENRDVLPSALMLDKRSNLLVGSRAYEQSAYSPENVAQGFKRLMGTSSELRFAGSDRVMSPEEASAEILRTLYNQARLNAGDFSLEGVVVTIPAAFNQMQCEATMRAADAAGLSPVALLQEPIAAAMASIASSPAQSCQFLVFDLGGGTFDAAIVQSISGSATIVGHSGINMLGGRDFDRFILNSIVRPWLHENFSLPQDMQKIPKYQRLLRIGQYRSEIAKISLSTQMVDRIFADESQLSCTDEDGQEIYLDVEISRADLERLVKPELDRAMIHCRALFTDCGYNGEDLDRVVMIGGPSRMPIVREMVENELGVRVDLAVDPMTAVASGAAIFAEGRDWSEGAVSKRSRGVTIVNAELGIRIDFAARTTETMTRISLQCDNEDLASQFRAEIRNDRGWTSGSVQLGARVEVRDIPLNVGDNNFQIAVSDLRGTPQPHLSQSIAITRALASSSGMPLTHNIAVKVVQGGFGAETNKLLTIVTKGVTLPRAGIHKLRAARDLRANDEGALEVSLYEQSEGVDQPELNLSIGVFRLSASFLGPRQIIRRGDNVLIHWTIDANGLLDCKVEVPAVEAIFDAGKMYIASAGHQSFDGEGGAKLAGQALAAAQDDIDNVERALGQPVAIEITELRRRHSRCINSLRLADDADTKRSAYEESRLIRQQVARIRARPEHRGSILRLELDKQVEFFDEQLAPGSDPKVVVQVRRLVGSARDALARGTEAGIREAERSQREIEVISKELMYKRPDFWVYIFDRFTEERHLAIDKSLHDILVREGSQAVRTRDIPSIRDVLSRMRQNMVLLSVGSGIDVLAGLME